MCLGSMHQPTDAQPVGLILVAPTCLVDRAAEEYARYFLLRGTFCERFGSPKFDDPMRRAAFA